MKGPGIKDYLAKLTEKKENAIKNGLKYIEISSKEFHQEVSPNHATMPTCCQAMYKCCLNGDEILRRPKGTTGYGSHLVIRFYLNDLNVRERMFPNKKRGRPRCCLNGDEILRRPKGTTGYGSHLVIRFYLNDLNVRERMFPNKKRGRPSKSPEEKLAARKAKMKHSTEDLTMRLEGWLENNGWKYSANKNEILAEQQDGKWVINIQGVKRGRKQTLPSKITELITKMDDPTVHYSLAFNDTTQTRRQWNEISPVVKEQLKLSVLLADKQGNIQEL